MSAVVFSVEGKYEPSVGKVKHTTAILHHFILLIEVFGTFLRLCVCSVFVPFTLMVQAITEFIVT
jgi:hypothetical protein